MMHCLIVGDPHLQVQRLDDAKEFIAKLKAEAVKHRILILLGDLFHTFAVVRSEVLSLWNEFFDWCHDVDRPDVITLVGNHDYSAQTGGSHALEVFRDRINVIQALVQYRGIYYMPFVRSKEDFETQARSIPPNQVLICHQSFNGAEFENGFIDPHGVDLACVAHLETVISGHIHRRQTVGKVWYPGTPFQHSFGEAGQEKRIFSLDLSPSGYSILREHDLDLPQFVTIEGAVSELADLLPHPDPRHSYKLRGRGTPMEIAEFWKEPKVRGFRSQARRVVDALIPERGQINLPGSQGKNRKEKLDAFIRSKKWRTSTEQLIVAAGDLLAD